MNVWVVTIEEFASDMGQSVYGVFADRALAEEAYETYVTGREDDTIVVREEDVDTPDGRKHVVRWLNTPDGDEFEADTWTMEETRVIGS